MAANQFTYDETPWQDEEVLRELYVDRGMSTYEMEDELGCSYQTVNNWLNKFGIERRKPNHEKLPGVSHNDKGYEMIQHQPVIDGETYNYRVYLHRLLAVAEYGFDAIVGMHVHHKNRCKFDNRPENIELLTDEEHEKVHRYERISARNNVDDKAMTPEEFLAL